MPKNHSNAFWYCLLGFAMSFDARGEILEKLEESYCIVPVVNQPRANTGATQRLFQTLPENPHVLLDGLYTRMWSIKDFNNAYVFKPEIDASYFYNAAYIKSNDHVIVYSRASPTFQIIVENEKITQIKDKNIQFKRENLEQLTHSQNESLHRSLQHHFKQILNLDYENKCRLCNYFLGIRGAELIDPVLMREKDAPAAEKLIITSRNGTFVLGYGKNKGKLCEKTIEEYDKHLDINKVYENANDVVLDVHPLNEEKDLIILQSGKFVLTGDTKPREIASLDAVAEELTLKQAMQKQTYLLNSKVIGDWLVFYDDAGIQYILKRDLARESEAFSMHLGLDVEFHKIKTKSQVRGYVQSAIKSQEWRKDRNVVTFNESMLVEKHDFIYYVNGAPSHEEVRLITKNRLAKMTNESDGVVFIYDNGSWHKISSNGRLETWTPKDAPTLGKRDEIYLVDGELYAHVREPVSPGAKYSKRSTVYQVRADGAEVLDLLGGRDGTIRIRYSDEEHLLFTHGPDLYIFENGKSELVISDPYRIGEIRKVVKLAPRKHLVSAAYGLVVLDESRTTKEASRTIHRVTFGKEYLVGGRIKHTGAGAFIYDGGVLYKIN